MYEKISSVSKLQKNLENVKFSHSIYIKIFVVWIINAISCLSCFLYLDKQGLAFMRYVYM